MSQEFPQAPDGNRQESNLSGAVLVDFLLLRLLGRGGMAEVYLAEQQSLRRQVAFKILRRDLAEDLSMSNVFTKRHGQRRVWFRPILSRFTRWVNLMDFTISHRNMSKART